MLIWWWWVSHGAINDIGEVCVCTHTCVCKCVHLYVHMHACVSVCVYMSVPTYVVCVVPHII